MHYRLLVPIFVAAVTLFGGIHTTYAATTYFVPVGMTKEDFKDKLDKLRMLIIEARSMGINIPISTLAFVGYEPTKLTNFTLDLKEGSTQSAEVAALQGYLIRQGYDIAGGANGVFGSETTAALASFQKTKKITPATGYFGAETRAYIKAHPEN